MVNWNKILAEDVVGVVRNFASGDASGRELYREFVYTPAGGEVRKLLRTHGTSYARTLAKKSLRRRTN